MEYCDDLEDSQLYLLDRAYRRSPPRWRLVPTHLRSPWQKTSTSTALDSRVTKHRHPDCSGPAADARPSVEANQHETRQPRQPPWNNHQPSVLLAALCRPMKTYRAESAGAVTAARF